jgi:AraC-like DNA-binding protein
MKTFAPSAALAPFVRSFTIVETVEEATRTLIPDTGVLLALRYSGKATQLEDGRATVLPNATLTGLRNTARRMHTSAGGGMVVTAFREGGAASILREPLHALFSETVELGELGDRTLAEEIERARERMTTATDHATRVRIVERFLWEQFLLQRVGREATRDALVTAAVRLIRDAGGSMSIASLGATLGVSQDRLEKRFRRTVGASPKQYASILRLRSAVVSYRTGSNLARLSVDAGYYDQPHFIRAFRSATGVAPRQFFRAGDYC